MNSRKTILLYSFLAAVILAPLVVVAGTVYDRLAPNVYIGQGSAVAEKMVFDTGHSASNAQFTSDSSGNMGGVLGNGSFSGTPTFTGNTTVQSNVSGTRSILFVANPTGGGTIAIASGASGGDTPEIETEDTTDLILGTNNTENMRIANGGNVGIGSNSPAATLDVSGVIAGSSYMTLGTSTSGGNVPHVCTLRTHTVSSTGATLTCNSGEIVMGGGCNGSVNVTATYPSSSTTWTCNFSAGGTVTAYGICCLY